MNEQIKDIIYRVTEEVLEKLAFIFSSPEEDRENISDDASVAACVSFTGPFTGSVVMTITSDTLPELAENMLGFDTEETTVDQQHDALKELINVICGNLLPAIAGKQVVFNVDPPEILSDSVVRSDGQKPVSVAKLALEDGQCDIILFVENKVSPEELMA